MSSLSRAEIAVRRQDVKVPVHVRAREYTSEVLAYWARVLRDEDEQTALRIRVSENLIERAWGKAPIVVVGDEERPITLDARTLPPEQMQALESALMAALGDAITRAALPSGAPALTPQSPSPPSLAATMDDTPAVESACAASTKGQHNVNESLTGSYPQAEGDSSRFVLGDAAPAKDEGLMGKAGGEGD